MFGSLLTALIFCLSFGPSGLAAVAGGGAISRAALPTEVARTDLVAGRELPPAPRPVAISNVPNTVLA